MTDPAPTPSPDEPRNIPAVLALVFGIVSPLCLPSVPAIIFGIIGVRKSRSLPGHRGRTMAFIGLALGVLTTLLWGALLAIMVPFFMDPEAAITDWAEPTAGPALTEQLRSMPGVHSAQVTSDAADTEYWITEIEVTMDEDASPANYADVHSTIEEAIPDFTEGINDCDVSVTAANTA